MTDEATRWLSCHVFYHGDPDPLLAGLLLPMVDGLRARGLARQAFFLRHWERGPHVRVRLRVADADADAVRDEVERTVTGYLREHPGPSGLEPEKVRDSLRHLSRLEHGTDEIVQVTEPEPPNSLRWIDYTPEWAKYGGPRGVAIAEKVFDGSSRLTAEVIRTISVDRARLGVSLQLLLLSARALGLDPAARAVFLRHYRERWTPYVPDPDRLFAAWDGQYRHQEGTYRALLRSVDRGDPVGGGLGQAWERLLGDALADLRPLVAAREVWPGEVAPQAPTFVALAALVCQYLHTTNNRMNVRPQGECFVAYLGHRAALDLAGAATPAGTDAADATMSTSRSSHA
ncbi:lantibiotic dehydratase C-terminal domain-containing protein [Micromonospora carbonacea]|uniref:lantibiotic dehydratase C-terminal domain-containing protein n=1 Tax=Micromonospora carbonacea TaxID=47853 RepID=UPI003D70C296